MQRLFLYLSSLLLSLAGVAANVTGDTRGADLLKQARAALGGEARLTRVEGLSCEGTFRRVLPDREMAGDLKIDLQLPDRILRTESFSMFGDATIVTEQGMNGDQPIRRSRTIGGGPNMVVRMGGPAGPDADAQAVRSARADLARLAIALGLPVPPELGVQFKYGGEAEAEDGKADVIDAAGSGNFAARLFLDQKTHRPLMLAYRGIAPRIVTQEAHGPRDHSVAPKPPEAPTLPPPQLVDVTMYFDEYRTVDGISLPHHFSRSVDGKPSEEWTFRTITVNPAFRADTFAVK